MVVVWNWNLILNLSLSNVVIALVSSLVSGSAGERAEMTTLSPSIFAFGALSSLPAEQPAATSMVAAVTATVIFRGKRGAMVPSIRELPLTLDRAHHHALREEA